MNDSLLQRIYDATNNGLDIILYYYPQAHGCDKKGKYFKIRGDEKTPSACMKEIKGVWRVTDFGDEQTAMAPIEICMREERLDFREALFRLADRYQVGNVISKEVNKSKIEQRDATADEPEGKFWYELKEKMTDEELKVLGPMVTQQTCERYSYFSVKFYCKVKNRKVTTISSTDTYPIFMRDCGEFRKIYQPLNPDKAFRFFYDGVKPKDYINGMAELKKAYEKYLSELDKEEEAEFDEEKPSDTSKPKKVRKLQEAILCSGERDALNVAGMGFYPLWMNSETAKLDGKTYNEIMKRVERLYNLPDMDDTGVRKGNELAMEYPEIYTIELPDWLATYRDHRGRPRKDLRDFVEIKPSAFEFKELMRVAMPCKFWEKTYTKNGTRLEINTLFLLHFLKVNGFGKIVDPANDQVTFVRVTDHRVKEIRLQNISDFVVNWAKEQKLDVEVQNLILNSARVSSSVFEKIDSISPNFKNYDSGSQTLFFDNEVVKVSAEGVEVSKGGTSVYAWDQTICKHSFKRIEPSFVTTYNEDTGYYQLEIKHTRSHYFRFLINASRIYWQEEFERRVTGDAEEDKKFAEQYHWAITSPRLTEEEMVEQVMHLLNKMFCIGYLLHSYKSFSKAWGVWVMENKITEEDESSGGSGKTFMLRFLNRFKNMEMLNGRDKKLTDNNFFMDRVTESTDLLLIDDATKYFNFNYFYSMLTDNMVVNYKNARSKEIPFSDSPKIVITSNFPPPSNDGSTARRILTCVFSDYYHKATDDNDYQQNMRIADDFGYDLHNEAYKWDWWNEDYNFCIDCLQFYLSTLPHNSMVEPPMENVDRRMRNQLMGDEFKEWAEVYFCQASENLDKLLRKQDVKDIFDPKHKYSTKGFTARLRAFCKNADYIEELNPEDCIGYDPHGKRIIRKYDGETREYIYLKTYNTEINNELA